MINDGNERKAKQTANCVHTVNLILTILNINLRRRSSAARGSENAANAAALTYH